MKIILSSIVLIFCLSTCLGYAPDEVTNLPGLSFNATFRQYSGYLTVGKGRYLHYWFVESQSNPKEDPVVLWLNGGPGCSSLIGFLSENGPFRVKSDGKTVVEHKHSWNKIANVLYLESPVGVGFSFDTNNSTVSDNSTAEDNYSALIHFFEKFKDFANNSFYITGESFGGYYVPLLAHQIFQNNSTINFKGVAIGNGLLTTYKNNLNNQVRFAYSHGLIDSLEYNDMIENCCKCSAQGGEVCDFGNQQSHNCTTISARIRINMIRNGINAYNIYSDCTPFDGLYSDDSPYRFSLRQYFGFNDEEIDELAQTSDDSNCVDFNAYKRYLNSVEVRKAIHINDGFPAWDQCSNTLKYQVQYTTMKPIFKDLIEKYKIKNLIVFNGDIDIVCDFLGDQQFVDELGYKLTSNYTKWSVGGRTAGFVKRYEGITFMTVRNAGHMVPTDQPEAALAIFKELLGISKVN